MKYLSKDFVCNNPDEKYDKSDFYISLILLGSIFDKLIKAMTESIKGTFLYTKKGRLRNEMFKEKNNY